MNKRMLRSVLAAAGVAVALAIGTAGPLDDVGWTLPTSAVADEPGDVGWSEQAATGDVGWGASTTLAAGTSTLDVGW